jgi:hypothetical protein
MAVLRIQILIRIRFQTMDHINSTKVLKHTVRYLKIQKLNLIVVNSLLLRRSGFGSRKANSMRNHAVRIRIETVKRNNDNGNQRVTKKCRLSWLTIAPCDVYGPKCGGRGGVAGSQPMSTVVPRSPIHI